MTARLACILLFVACVLVPGAAALAQASQGLGQAGGAGPGSFGPFDAQFPAGGDELTKPTPVPPADGAPIVAPIPLPGAGPWTLRTWVQAETVPGGLTVLGGLAPAPGGVGRFLALIDGKAALMVGNGTISGGPAISPGRWAFIAASFEAGTARLAVNGKEVASGRLAPGAVLPALVLAPRRNLPAGATPLAGRLAGFAYVPKRMVAAELQALAAREPNVDLTNFQSGSPAWPVQIRQMYGQTAPQDPWTRPVSKAPFSPPVAIPAPNEPPLQPDGAGWLLRSWRLAAAPGVTADGAALSSPGYDATAWYAATVPGTVLTTLIDRGFYPDPDYGLNNLAIPESLNKQDYWYRTEFTAPVDLAGRDLTLTFKGVNYQAEAWLNGERLGTIKGAFTRGRFDVTGKLRPGVPNALAVRVSPPPHPGLPHEESLTSGVGENGGMAALDGPNFMASEGWDWIPTVRDRNTGLWQDVVLTAAGSIHLGDAQVVTILPKPDNSEADIEITVPVENRLDHPVDVTLTAGFDDVSVTKPVTLAPGAQSVVLSKAEFPALAVAQPRLWWPNGYGDPALHQLTLSVAGPGGVSDRAQLRFGMREVTYELSLMDQGGQLRRVEVDLAKARALGAQIVDVRHGAIHKVAGGWVASLVPGAEASPAVTALDDTRLAPYLVLKVNGVRIAARGGSWGTDDWRKRVSRAHLEPYFRLHRDAHMNIIRNWVGQNTEDVFYDLADEYGLMVLNDFWESTEDYQLEAQDVPLFLDNAADVIRRYRNHPSIVLWFGRNEGMPQPVLNEGLARLVATLDGTRYYTGSSNRINLQDSGPYSYQAPELYFTKHAKGFAVEVGTPSFPTLEAFEAVTPEPDRWPISDVWAYHDWHQSGNGAVKSFTDTMAAKFGAPTSLADFERKAQMLNYDSYRAIFEGMNAELWTRNSGRLLWMTQPAWPSTAWQILSHDYDTHAAFYGSMKAAEKLHVQMNLPDYRLAVVNNSLRPLAGLVLTAHVVALDNRMLLDRRIGVEAAANATTSLAPLPLGPLLAKEGTILVRLRLADAQGTVLSDNFYWPAADDRGARRLNRLPAEPLAITAAVATGGADDKVTVTLRNDGPAPVLLAKLTLFGAKGERILPAYYSDNYVSLLPGETRSLTIAYPAEPPTGAARLTLRGWNVAPAEIPITPAR
jgi:Exo-beta-D-glucosaminidase Ig-fold domain/Glycosyl hydrolases family 2/Concanavalin A-like lectin/glucanases superfamily/Glycosyl hydrolases family 2, TIM barrel domain